MEQREEDAPWSSDSALQAVSQRPLPALFWRQVSNGECGSAGSPDLPHFPGGHRPQAILGACEVSCMHPGPTLLGKSVQAMSGSPLRSDELIYPGTVYLAKKPCCSSGVQPVARCTRLPGLTSSCSLENQSLPPNAGSCRFF